jgi:hypothetical protein
VSAVGRRFALAEEEPANGADPTELVTAVTEAAKGLRFGSIEVVVHEGRVVQVVRTEKRRVLR